MSRNKCLKASVTGVIGGLCLLPSFSPITSCSETTVWQNIHIPSSSFTVNVHQFSVPAYFNFNPTEQVVAELQNNDIQIKLANRVLEVQNDSADLNFVIDEQLTTSKRFQFDIKFMFYDDQMRLQTFTIYNVVVFYTVEVIIEKDPIWLESYYSTSTNVHRFQFVCDLPTKPMSRLIHVSLSNKSSNLFELEKEDYTIIETGQVSHIDIELLLDMRIFKKCNFSFDMTISFINSYGKSQVNFFPNCAMLFDVQKNAEVPSDYLNLIPIGDNKYELSGLKPNVSPLEAGHFSVLRIPNNVVSIYENAFADNEWFVNIRKIYIPSTVTRIGHFAFAGCNNTTEFDISEYGETPPPWQETPDLFDKQTFKSIGGFVWAGQHPDLNLLHSCLLAWGLPQRWNAYNADMVSKPDDFTYSTDQKVVITGLEEEKLENFKHYKVIKIPDTVEKINEDSFKFLKENPYIAPESTEAQPIYETRELIIGSDFKDFSGLNFKDGGYSGNILFYCNDATSFEEHAFSNMHNYGWPGMYDIKTDPIQLIFAECYGLSDISSYAFNYVPVENDVWVFDKTVSNVGDFAFQGNNFRKIVFTDYIQNVGEYAFANVFLTPHTPHLEEIDLSCYHKIIDPSQEEPTHIPSWFDSFLSLFEGSCVPDGRIYVSEEVFTDIWNKEEPEEWIETFKTIQGIPQDWYFEVKR